MTYVNGLKAVGFVLLIVGLTLTFVGYSASSSPSIITDTRTVTTTVGGQTSTVTQTQSLSYTATTTATQTVTQSTVYSTTLTWTETWVGEGTATTVTTTVTYSNAASKIVSCPGSPCVNPQQLAGVIGGYGWQQYLCVGTELWYPTTIVYANGNEAAGPTPCSSGQFSYSVVTLPGGFQSNPIYLVLAGMGTSALGGVAYTVGSRRKASL